MNIREFLLENDIFPNIKGYNYIIKGVELVKQHPDMPIVKGLYPAIAKIYNSTASKVERAMRHVIADKIALYSFNKIGINKVPTVGEFIWYVALEGGKKNG